MQYAHDVYEIGGPASWRGPEIVDDDGWKRVVDPAALGPAVDRARTLARSIADDPDGLRSIGRDRAELSDLPELEQLGRWVQHQLLQGTGFALLRGLPVDELDPLENEVLYWMIGLHVGIPIHQNQHGQVLVRVADEGKSFDEIGVRAYETSARLDYHTDSSDVVGLYCLRPAMQGGTSTIVSSVAVHDAIVRERPDLAPLLYEPWPQVSAIDHSVTYLPIVATDGAGRLFSRYGRKYIEMAPELHADVAPLTAAQVEVLDLYDRLSHSDSMPLDMNFRPGDIQFLNNYVIMHSRTEYVDWPERERRRELLRIWLVVRDGLDLPPVFEDSGFVPRSVAFANG